MEPNETQQHYFTTNTTTTVTTTPSPTNGLLPPSESGGSHHMVYPHPMPSAVTSPLEPARRKRGRPRKYGTPEQALAAKKTASSSSKERREQQQQQHQLALGGGGASLSGLSKKSQLVALGNAGQGFTPHVINVVAGEDVGQKIMMFMQQSKREICILSASGTISNASLRQPATSGGNITYEGRFEIISLSGSYVRTETGGRTGGLSVCLSSADGQIIGGGIGGPLKAAGPVQVIVGTFVIDNKKDVSAGAKGDASGSKLPSPVGGTSVSNVGFRSAFETSGRNPIGGNDDHQSFGGSHFMMQPRGMHVAPRPSEWRSGLDDRTGFELTGKTGHGAHQSPENGDYDQIAD
ncbi:PREDICTED: AT-hook motif nuclear-localized protein 14 [Theobroma cacao]|uniref:AT-hook motif nuclear-localized protein n=2 Tax=Theobroma cacao TaxID=3641 RepID=A0AB32V5W8_THECC|nr:PREDICTED: AT-hook motif nuclear-localized protein 14 [Theobroma cacao]EOY10989.1 AT hook motif DNA-binding family protein [Theobroma cacao]